MVTLLLSPGTVGAHFPYNAVMIRKIACAIVSYVSLTSAAVGLPPDVMAFPHKAGENANCLPAQTDGKTPDQLVKEYVDLLASRACAAQEAERRALADRYKGNRDVLNALMPKIGFVGFKRY